MEKDIKTDVLRVCGLVHTLNKYGGVRRYLELGNEFIKRGYEFDLLTEKQGQEQESWIDFKGRIKPRIIDGTRYNIAFTGAYECFDDIIKINADKKIIFVVAKFYKDKYLELWNKVKNNGYQWVGVAEDWNKGMERIQGRQISGGVNTDFFKPDWTIRRTKLTVCFYGRLGTGRGAEILNKIAGEQKDKFNFIIFDDPAYNHIISDNYRATKTQEELLKVYQESDIVLSYMNSAGWNNVIAEGMACGCVPISNSSGTKDIIINNYNGFIIKNPEELVQKLEYLNANRGRLGLMQREAHQYIQGFNWVNFVDKLILC